MYDLRSDDNRLPPGSTAILLSFLSEEQRSRLEKLLLPGDRKASLRQPPPGLRHRPDQFEHVCAAFLRDLMHHQPSSLFRPSADGPDGAGLPRTGDVAIPAASGGAVGGGTVSGGLSMIRDDVAAAYLDNEYVQTIAAILLQTEPEFIGRVLMKFAPETATNVVMRMVNCGMIASSISKKLQQVVCAYLANRSTGNRKTDPYDHLAQVFNYIESRSGPALLEQLKSVAPSQASHIEARMFTFKDFLHMDPDLITIVLQQADQKDLAVVLRSLDKPTSQKLMTQMSARAAKLLTAKMANMKAAPAAELNRCQQELVTIAKRVQAEAGV
jgi:flagellar motility protein MotE (MotC chaperone)